MSKTSPISAVFFDLDGTLLDTAPDMVASLNQLLNDCGEISLPFAQARAYVSTGAIGLVRLGFPHLDESNLETMRLRFIDTYAKNLCIKTALFAGLAESLAGLDDAGIPWGVVTNKPAALTEPLLQKTSLLQRCASVVSGDTLPQRKPHPAPLLHAALLAQVDPMRTVYVGDARSDIEASKAAGMRSIAAGYGYILPNQDPRLWGADFFISDSRSMHECISRLLSA